MSDLSPDLFDYLLLIFVLAAMALVTWIRFTKLPSMRSLSPGKMKRRPCHAKMKKGAENVPIQKSNGRPQAE
jgi:hypothetical protein